MKIVPYVKANLHKANMNIAAIVLTGGQSSRMGRDKAFIEIKGQPLLTHICTAAQQVTEQIYIVARAEQVDAIHKLSQGWRVVIDQQLDGAMIGFWQGLQAIAEPCDWILLLACDLPNLHGQTLQIWSQQLDHSLTAIAYLPKHNDHWEPLCGFYAWHCQSSLAQFIQSGRRSFQHWLQEQVVIEIDHRASPMLLNCNTPKDLERHLLTEFGTTD
ncbi:MAG: molybdenum cofactor guanylyltransferase [Pseudanabaenaceae cyanobacterium bins.39]|nr:molybdenum cofactor guanylyltransferase [Pseudanabaenaceae cyanobacterium bins.39]